MGKKKKAIAAEETGNWTSPSLSFNKFFTGGRKAVPFLFCPFIVSPPVCADIRIPRAHTFTAREESGEPSWHPIRLTYQGYALLSVLLPSVFFLETWPPLCCPARPLRQLPARLCPSEVSQCFCNCTRVFVCLCVSVCVSVPVLPQCSFSFNS